jgi:hypothetical protein
MPSKIFQQALDAVGVTREPSRFADWQPVWQLPEQNLFGKDTQNIAFIVLRSFRNTFGNWMVECVPETNIHGPHYTGLQEHLTDKPPVGHGGSLSRYTLTDVPLYVIDGGFE